MVLGGARGSRTSRPAPHEAPSRTHCGGSCDADEGPFRAELLGAMLLVVGRAVVVLLTVALAWLGGELDALAVVP
jgi:hypothetical protein